MAEFPNSTDLTTLAAFIAWNLAAKSFTPGPDGLEFDKRLDYFEQAFPRIYNALKGEPEPPQKARTVERG